MSGSYSWTASVRIACCAFITATSSLNGAITEKEILAHEKILALWKDGELALAEGEIAQIKEAVPSSELLPQLLEIEANIAWEQRAYAKVKSLLKEQSSPPLQKLYAKALFALEDYEELTSLKTEGIEALQGLAHLKLRQYVQARSLLNRAHPSKSTLIGLIDALIHLDERNMKGELKSAIDHLLPLLSPAEQGEYLRLKAHVLMPDERAAAVEILERLIDDATLRSTPPSTLRSPLLAGLAASDILHALVEVEEPSERLRLAEKIAPHLPEKNAPLAQFWIGHSLVALDECERAKGPLQLALNGEMPSPFREKLRETLFYIAEKREDLPLAEVLLQGANSARELKQALDIKWRLATKSAQYTEARSAAEKLLEIEGQSDRSLLYALHSACQLNEFGRAMDLAERFIELGEKRYAESLERYFSAAARRATDRSKALALVQRWQEIFGKGASLARVQAELLIELGQKKEAAELIENEADFPNKGSLLCICYSPEEPVRASAWGERALTETGTSSPPTHLHLQLYNLYCEIARQAIGLPQGHPKSGQDPLDLAADHLYAVFKEQPGQISEPNKTWLCNHLLRNDKWQREGLLLFAKLPNPSKELVYFAGKVTPRCEEAKKLFARSLALSKESGDLFLQCASLTAQGQAELRGGKKEQARTCFKQAIDLKVPSHEADLAKLALYQLDYASCALDTKRAKSDLKDLQLRKSIDKEPLFLDAALLYVDICSSENPEKKRHLLEQMRSDFSIGETLFGKHYQKQREKFPREDALLKNYMLFVDLHIEALAGGVGREDLQADKKRLRTTLANLEGSLKELKATSPELSRRAYQLKEQIISMLK